MQTRLGTLRRGIRLARQIDRLAMAGRINSASKLVAVGFLVRNRRLAEAVAAVDTAAAYEGRMLLRTMNEIMFNHAWIRLKSKHSRAIRFLAFQPLELLRVHASLKETLIPEEFEATRRLLEGQRRAVRHLFRFRDSKGKMRWAQSWAAVSSVEARIREVRTAEAPDKPDEFMYALYSWISSAVHGGPNSIKEMFVDAPGKIRIRPQPERDASAQIVGASACLAHTMNCTVEDFGLKHLTGAELARYVASVKNLRNVAVTLKRPRHLGQSTTSRS